ncbi:MAG: hypothetical protein JWQ09_4435 [Segetibacter sp.]|nr:hypothetical protein [Segetibacter sp.]
MFKRIILFNGCFLHALITLAQTDTALCDYSGCLGDIKYSILRSDSFRKINGSGWILLNGNTDTLENSLFRISKLKNLMGIATLPDARGVFLRGMNLGRSKDSGNADGDTRIGTYQRDTFSLHQHKIDKGYGGGGGGYVQNAQWGPHNTDQTTQGVGGNETRPRNIVVFIYIKIN